MKANELMIDDWVMVAECVADAHFRYYPDKIESIRDGLVGLESDGLETIIERIDPIPLTAEILEKNGFIIKEKWAQIGNFGDNPLIMWHFVDDLILRDYNTELEIHQNDTGKIHVCIPCEYVHELQHALRLCGIEKTIEL